MTIEGRELSVDQASAELGRVVATKLSEITTNEHAIHELAKLRRAIESLERARPDDQDSPFIGEEVVSLGDVLATIDLASVNFWPRLATGGTK